MAQKELLHRKYHETDRIPPDNPTVGCGQKQKVGGQETVWIKLQLLLIISDKNCMILWLSSCICRTSIKGYIQNVCYLGSFRWTLWDEHGTKN